ncbi:hypothetical protein DY218_01435 [Streptomyces triticagri]|uniref:Uncharacterized protein n=1 Tax=Streptomyces triticagri TaxID=2293568 RepID=A0A372MDD2_9ACTN|nr:hypothetical protein [Streptomyces triticagri]RFU88505.1 hypothetical protein DY218_01435 [Streptomyces triticagri]
MAERGLLEGDTVSGYRHPGSLREHAEQAAFREDGLAGCKKALERTVHWYARLVVAAGTAALPEAWRLHVEEQAEPGRYADPGEAMAALDAEFDGAVQAVLAAASSRS